MLIMWFGKSASSISLELAYINTIAIDLLCNFRMTLMKSGRYQHILCEILTTFIAQNLIFLEGTKPTLYCLEGCESKTKHKSSSIIFTIQALTELPRRQDSLLVPMPEFIWLQNHQMAFISEMKIIPILHFMILRT